MRAGAYADPRVQRFHAFLVGDVDRVGDFHRMPQFVAEQRDRIFRRTAQRDLNAHVAMAVRRRQDHQPSFERAGSHAVSQHADSFRDESRYEGDGLRKARYIGDC